MLKFIVKRLLWMIPVLLGVLLLIFTIDYFTPGDPVAATLGSNYTPEQYALREAQLGLDKPFFVQFFVYAKNLVTKGSLGTSYYNGLPVAGEIWKRFPSTLLLGLIGVFITVALGIPLGVISATKQYSAADYSLTTLSMILAAMPNFWLAIMLVLLFAVNLRWLPVSGLNSWKGWILPCLSLGLMPIASIVRMTRSSMLEEIRKDYVRTAKAKGISNRTVIQKHALKNALIPVITVIGFQLGMIMGGSVVIESIFAIPGLGSLMQTGINNRDYPVIMGCVLVLSACVCIMNLLVDVVYALVDPRIKAQYTAGNQKKRRAKTAGSEVTY